MTDLPQPSLTTLYGHSLANGSAERRTAVAAASTVWISLDPLAGESEPPEGIVWLRLGEPGLGGNGWRNVLSQVAKLMPALEALGITDVQPLSEAARMRGTDQAKTRPNAPPKPESTRPSTSS